MVTVKYVNARKRSDGFVEVEAVVTVASGDTITSGDVELNTIYVVTAAIPLAPDNVLTGIVINNPGSYDNSFTIKAYSLTAGSLTTESGSIDWVFRVVGE